MPVQTSVRTNSLGEGRSRQPFRVSRKAGHIIVHDLPIVDEHDVFDENGEFIKRCDKSLLEKIAFNNNRRERQTGDETPITIGHTKDDAPESQQPPIVGYARGHYVAPLFNTGRHALFVREARFPEHFEDEIRKYPRRSVEIWFDGEPMVDPIALLGASTPERDLGLMRLSKHGRRIKTSSFVGKLKTKMAKVARQALSPQTKGTAMPTVISRSERIASLAVSLCKEERLSYEAALEEAMNRDFLGKRSPIRNFKVPARRDEMHRAGEPEMSVGPPGRKAQLDAAQAEIRAFEAWLLAQCPGRPYPEVNREATQRFRRGEKAPLRYARSVRQQVARKKLAVMKRHSAEVVAYAVDLTQAGKMDYEQALTAAEKQLACNPPLRAKYAKKLIKFNCDGQVETRW